MPVSNKIHQVSDDLCELCAQCWESQCRAYQVPHSDEERAQRISDPKGLCQISVLRWGYDIDHPERLQPKEVSHVNQM